MAASFLLVFRGHILKLATLIADIISLSSWFFPFSETLEVILTSSEKKLLTKFNGKFSLDTLSAKQVDKNVLLKTSVIEYIILSFAFFFFFWPLFCVNCTGLVSSNSLFSVCGSILFGVEKIWSPQIFSPLKSAIGEEVEAQFHHPCHYLIASENLDHHYYPLLVVSLIFVLRNLKMIVHSRSVIRLDIVYLRSVIKLDKVKMVALSCNMVGVNNIH